MATGSNILTVVSPNEVALTQKDLDIVTKIVEQNYAL